MRSGRELGAPLSPCVFEPPQQMAALLPMLAEREKEIVTLVLPEHAPEVAMGVYKAALAALERVLLEGPGRSFTALDGEAHGDGVAEAHLPPLPWRLDLAPQTTFDLDPGPLTYFGRGRPGPLVLAEV